jgi:hypothetical protein
MRRANLISFQEVPFVPKALDLRIKQYVSPHAPLGPSDASQIKDVEVAARLFDPHNKSFNSLLRKDLSVVIGRRGSGKTALLNSYRYRPYLGKVSPDTYGSDFRSYDYVIEITTYKKFQEMQRRIVKDPMIFQPIEAIVDDWGKLIIDYFLASLVAKSGDKVNYSEHLQSIQNYLKQDVNDYENSVRRSVWGISLWSSLKHFLTSEPSDSTDALTREEAVDIAIKFLKIEKKRAVIIFDSMDEYDVGNDAFDRTIGALVRFIAHFNTNYERIKIKLGLPSEIFPEIQRASGNPLKDLVSFDQVQWTAMELMELAAYRYYLFLSLYDPECSDELKHLDLNRRDDVHRFWGRFFSEKQINRYGAEEEATTYILRHTQLLPRQLLMILQRVVVASYKKTGGYRSFPSEVVRGSIEDMESVVAGEVFGAFRHIYPFAEDIGRAVFGNQPTVFSYDQLEDQWRKKARPHMRKMNQDFEMVHFSDMLVRMGILGLIAGETELYYDAKFGYGLLSPFNTGSGNQLCLHPIFSKFFNASGNAKQKPVAPQGASLPSREY